MRGLLPAFLVLSLPLLTTAQPLTQSFFYQHNIIFQHSRVAGNSRGEALLAVSDQIGRGHLLLIDANGNEKWSIVSSNLNEPGALGLSNGDWLLYGHINISSNSDYSLHLVDENGDLKWTRRWGESSQDKAILNAFELSQGGVLIASNSNGPGGLRQELLLISLQDGSILNAASTRTNLPMFANDAALIGDRVYFFGTNPTSSSNPVPILSILDTSLSKRESYIFRDLELMAGQSISQGFNGKPVLLINSIDGSDGALILEFDATLESTGLSARRLQYPLSDFFASHLRKAEDGFILAGSLNSPPQVGPAFIASLDKDFNTKNGVIDTSQSAQPLSHITRLGSDKWVYSRNINFQKITNNGQERSSFKPGISLQVVNENAEILNCAGRFFTFMHSNGSINFSTQGASLKTDHLYTNFGSGLSPSENTFKIEPSCGPFELTADFEVSDSIVCSGDSVLFIDQSSGANNSVWHFSNPAPDSVEGPNPPKVQFRNPGTYLITQIVNNLEDSDTTTKLIKVIRKPELRLPADTRICFGDTVRMEAKGFIEDIYQWSPAEAVSPTNQRLTFFHPTASTIIKGSVSNQGNCLVEDSFFLEVTPEIGLQSNSPLLDSICPGDTRSLSITKGDFEISWSTGDTVESIEAKQAGTYTVQIINRCFTKERSFEIRDVKDCPVSFTEGMANAFTPNNDGFNDVWLLSIPKMKEAELWIYSRWGQLVYYQQSAQPIWDGKLLEGEVQEGQYFYRASVKLMDDSTKQIKGQVILIR